MFTVNESLQFKLCSFLSSAGVSGAAPGSDIVSLQGAFYVVMLLIKHGVSLKITTLIVHFILVLGHLKYTMFLA